MNKKKEERWRKKLLSSVNFFSYPITHRRGRRRANKNKQFEFVVFYNT